MSSLALASKARAPNTGLGLLEPGVSGHRSIPNMALLSVLGGPWDLVTTYNWLYNLTFDHQMRLPQVEVGSYTQILSPISLKVVLQFYYP